MSTAVGSSVSAASEQRAVCELIDRLGVGWRPREPLAGQRIAVARRELAECGVWALGLAEADGGGGADPATVALAIARVAGYWPALGLAMAHLHAAGVASPKAGVLHGAAAEGLPVAVVEVPSDLLGPVSLDRVDVGDPGCDLVLVHAGGCALVPAGHAEFGPARSRTGLDGATSVPVGVPEGAATEIAGGRDLADAVRAALYTGQLAVAAGLADAAERYARDYTAGRVQFGAPLAALPTMREQLSVLRGQAATLLATAMHPPAGAADVAAALRVGLDVAVDAAGAALGCLGGYGYLEEYPLAGLFRDAISLRAAASGGSVVAQR